MSVAVDLVRHGPGGGPRRQELVECLPALRESLERERAFRVERPALDGAREALADIERALTAIRAGTYGSCEHCAAEIPFTVLRAVPRTRSCLRCHRSRAADEPVRVEARCATSSAMAAESGEHATPAGPVLWVRRLLGRAIVGPEQQHLGHVRDVVVTSLPDGIGTVVTGLIGDAGGHGWFAPVATVDDLQRRRVVLRAFSIRPAGCWLATESLLVQDVLGRPVMTAPAGPPRRVSDIALRRTPAGWTVWAVDTRTTAQRLLGSPRRRIEWDALAVRRLETPATGAGGTGR